MSISESTAAQVSADQIMHALRLHERGGPERLVYEAAPMPPVALGDALIRVYATSVTPTELRWPATWEDRAGRDHRPVIPGNEARL